MSIQWEAWSDREHPDAAANSPAQYDEASKRDYRVVKAKKADGRRVLVLWRDMDRLDPVAERKFLEGRLKEDRPLHEARINGDTATPVI